jgi:hypothetical protein
VTWVDEPTPGTLGSLSSDRMKPTFQLDMLMPFDPDVPENTKFANISPQRSP